ncbi:D-arabinose 1-dehydrogenase (NAD(+)) [Purpureocillium takamizusanense]|uniref:D-arabinose 1-dehydrogenase (NAD(+)) n=1 Tax=Purpureocillium takamizusanense TaxID=2060973 RepID=A0A9Q8QP68_9HYPO|nr:D-arabinose 1-dehydrogenase (NAD(+)) [Purpureocillium takamizusanense]UNI22812.1 D-arabinose 1-dehydrogenase (NAD(+)) [Purpureocillium takamizusanense]
MATSLDGQRPALSQVLPPLILGTATFNTQYHPDPTHMPYTDIVRRALEHNIAAFDTSPYYGPSETLLGDALGTLTPPPRREDYFLITKAGRIAGREFDYSPAWIRYSVCRSLERLGTPYLDLVYAHDVEFVSPQEVLAAVQELRSLRDQGLVRYVGISGYPVEVLASLAEMVLEQTGEPLDAVLSYSHFCVQNGTLGRPDYLERFRAAGVECVLNASMLSMGLLTTRGVDNGPQASWHPAPPGLRKACSHLAELAARRGEHLEEVAIRWALENWARIGASLGTVAYPAGVLAEFSGSVDRDGAAVLPPRIGVSVMGVAAVEELEETWQLWKSVVGLASRGDVTTAAAAAARKDQITAIVRDEMWPALGAWKDFAWESGGEGFVNERDVSLKGVVPRDGIAERWGLVASKKVLDSAKI